VSEEKLIFAMVKLEEEDVKRKRELAPTLRIISIEESDHHSCEWIRSG
jgi:hypothetical protein